MATSAVATQIADQLNADALRQIARHILVSVNAGRSWMHTEEVQRFENLEAAINDVLELQSERV